MFGMPTLHKELSITSPKSNSCSKINTPKSTQSKISITFNTPENNLKFIKKIKKEIPKLVQKIATECSELDYTETELKYELEEELEDLTDYDIEYLFPDLVKKYITIKIPYTLARTS